MGGLGNQVNCFLLVLVYTVLIKKSKRKFSLTFIIVRMLVVWWKNYQSKSGSSTIFFKGNLSVFSVAFRLLPRDTIKNWREIDKNEKKRSFLQSVCYVYTYSRGGGLLLKTLVVHECVI